MSPSPLAVVAMLILPLAAVVGPAAALEPDKENDARAKRFVEYYEATVRPLEIEAARLFWTANVTGKEEDFQKKQEAEEKLDLALSDPAAVRRVEGDQGRPACPIRCWPGRSTSSISNTWRKQVDPELLKKILAKSNAVEQAFNVFRPKVDGKELTDNDVRRILRESRDSAERRAAWEASKKVGPVVVGRSEGTGRPAQPGRPQAGLQELPRHATLLRRAEPGAGAQAVRRTRRADPRAVPPGEGRDRRRAGQELRHRASAELRPWHYHDPFFQEAPAVLGELPESVYKPLDIRSSCAASSTTASGCRSTTCWPQRPVREAGQEPARLLHRHRPPGRRPRAGEHRARPGVAGHHAARAGPRRVLEERAAAACPTCCGPTPIRSAPRAWP